MARSITVRDREYRLGRAATDGWAPISRLELGWLIAEWQRSSFDREELRDALIALYPFELAGLDARRLLDHARRRLEEGSWVLLRKGREALSNEAVAESEAEPPDLTAAVEPAHHWIQIEVVDDEGLPVPNVLVEIKKPDGRLTTQRTSSEGVLYLADLDPGQCEIRLLELDATSWRLE